MKEFASIKKEEVSSNVIQQKYLDLGFLFEKCLHQYNSDDNVSVEKPGIQRHRAFDLVLHGLGLDMVASLYMERNVI